MKLKKIGNNVTEIQTDNYIVLFSYDIPVAYKNHTGLYSITSQKYSKTTSKHINAWVMGQKSQIVSQSVIDSLFSYLTNGKEDR